MRVPLLGAIAVLAAFAVFKGTHAAGCNTCPDLFVTENNEDYTCDCEDSFYEPSTKKCVHIIECPQVEALIKVFLNTLVSTGVEAISSSIVTSMMDYLLEDDLNVSPPNNDTESTQPVTKGILESFGDVINGEIKDILIKESGNISAQFGYLTNPYLMKNKKFLQACDNNTMCVVQKIMMQNQKKLEKVVGSIIPQKIDELISSLRGINTYAEENCKEGECPVIKTVVRWKDVLIEILQELKDSSGYLAKSLVKAIVTTKPVDNEAFNKILSKLGASNH